MNPASRIKANKEISRDRFLQPDELPAFFASLEADEPILHNLFKLALLTGARRSNVQAMRWERIQGDVCRIPDTKNGDPVNVPLVAEAVAILNERRAAANGSPWVFPSHSEAGHIVEVKTAWKRILDRAKLSNLRMHNLRRTMGSWQVATGANLPIVGKMLGQKSQQATAVYARLAIDPVRDAATKATAAIMAASKAKPRKAS